MHGAVGTRARLLKCSPPWCDHARLRHGAVGAPGNRANPRAQRCSKLSSVPSSVITAPCHALPILTDGSLRNALGSPRDTDNVCLVWRARIPASHVAACRRSRRARPMPPSASQRVHSRRAERRGAPNVRWRDSAALRKAANASPPCTVAAVWTGFVKGFVAIKCGMPSTRVRFAALTKPSADRCCCGLWRRVNDRKCAAPLATLPPGRAIGPHAPPARTRRAHHASQRVQRAGHGAAVANFHGS